MKNKIYFLSLFLLLAMAASAQETPNLYRLKGGTLHITYSTATQHFVYQDAHQTLQFSGQEIQTVVTPIGTLVTVIIRRTIDTGSTTFTLLVPKVNLDASKSAPLHTFGITTIHKFSVVPAFNRGQVETYTTTELNGTAAVAIAP